MGRAPTTNIGVLGVVSSDPEVIAVYPSLSSTVLPHSQEIRLFRGDSCDLAVQIQDDGDPANTVMISNTILRFAAKQGHGGVPSSLRNKVILGNEAALILKTSYDPEQIEVTNETTGRALIHLLREDTHLLPVGTAAWDLEITKATDSIDLPSGQVLFSGNSDVVMSITPALDWTALRLRPGDIFCAQGMTVLILEILSSQHMRVDWSGWTPGTVATEASPCLDTVCIYRGSTKTVAYGTLVILGDVVR